MLKTILAGDLSAAGKIFSSLQSRNYRLYFTGQGLSLIGTWMNNIALSWLVYRLTGSVFLLGLVGFTTQIPTFVLAPFAGVMTDRFDRLRIMTLTQVLFLIQAAIMTLLVFFNLIQVWHIIALSIFFGVISAFDTPARQSLVVQLIDRPEDLGNAIALNSAIFNGARLIGPAIAGVTIAAAGESFCFLVNTLSFLAVIVALLNIKTAPLNKKTSHTRFRDSFSEGFNYTFQSVPIRSLILLLAVMSLFGLTYIVLMPAYAKEILNGDAKTLGYLMSSMGAGALIAALYMAARQSVVGLSRIIALSVSLMGISVILASFSANKHLSSLVFFFSGLGMVLSLSSINTMIQTIADEDKRGRVMSFYAMALMGTVPFGNLMAGGIASAIGIPHTILICGIITLIAGIWFGIMRKKLRIHIRNIYITKGILPGIPDQMP